MQLWVQGIAVSPLGSSIAIFREEYHPVFQPGGDYDHVVDIVDSKTMKNTEPIKFVSDRMRFFPNCLRRRIHVACAAFQMEIRRPYIQGSLPDRYPASVHFYDIASGSQVRSSPIRIPTISILRECRRMDTPCLPTRKNRTPALTATMATGKKS